MQKATSALSLKLVLQCSSWAQRNQHLGTPHRKQSLRSTRGRSTISGSPGCQTTEDHTKTRKAYRDKEFLPRWVHIFANTNGDPEEFPNTDVHITYHVQFQKFLRLAALIDPADLSVTCFAKEGWAIRLNLCLYYYCIIHQRKEKSKLAGLTMLILYECAYFFLSPG